MKDVEPYGLAVLLVSGAGLVAVLANRVGERIRVPAPAIVLVVAALASDLFPVLGTVPIRTDERIVTVALILILFDGGMNIGWRRFREAAVPIAWVGVAGTFLTAGALALLCHLAFGFGWQAALLLGTALAPTDPAVVFSVLGGREISGRTGTILEGESGVNDPVGIALMAVLLGSSGGLGGALQGVGAFALQMVVGGVVGVLGAYLLLALMRRIALPNQALYLVRALAGAGVIYGAATVLHGSGFLAVFLAGILIGDQDAPHREEIDHFTSGLSSIAEIVAFTVLGLTISLSDAIRSDRLLVGLALAAALTVVIRPVLVGLLLLPVRLGRGERAFVLWSGLKGAVPILLGTFVLSADVAQARRLYSIVFVVVLVSVVIQGGLVPTAARLLRVPTRDA